MANHPGSDARLSRPTMSLSQAPQLTKPQPSDVLLIPEILVLILNELSPVELLTTARAVCKHWQTTIDSTATLRWKTWSQYTPVPPPSIRHLYLNDCIPSSCPTSSRDNYSGTCNLHPYSNVFEINPLALDLVQRVWRRCMRLQRKVQHIPVTPHQRSEGYTEKAVAEKASDRATSTAYALQLTHVGAKLRQLREACSRKDGDGGFCPSMGLLRPVAHAKNIWIYAGTHRSSLGMDTRTYHYNSTVSQGNTIADTVKINVLANTLLEGWQLRMREPRDARSFLCLPRKKTDEEEYYALVIQVFGNPADTESGRGVVGDTEITIKLQMTEPYSITSIETSSSPSAHRVHVSMRWPDYIAAQFSKLAGS
ncbi:hypothetical protein AA313_de0206692 [Arthrobotrys entomopaga]|nr:hypothetical protein AA313_de0206692 [Arthrobotrys entomopaga]